MLQKKTFKVLAAIAKRDGSHWWMKCGSAHTNKDDSINVYLDAVPRDLKFQLRELDEEDLRRREAYRAGTSAGTGTGEAGPPGDGYVARTLDAGSPAANTAAPF